MKKAFIDVVRANEYYENLSVRQTVFVDGFGSWGSDGPADMFIAPIPKGKIFDVMREINKAKTKAPVSIGDVIIENVLGLDVNIVATRNVGKKN